MNYCMWAWSYDWDPGVSCQHCFALGPTLGNQVEEVSNFCVIYITIVLSYYRKVFPPLNRNIYINCEVMNYPTWTYFPEILGCCLTCWDVHVKLQVDISALRKMESWGFCTAVWFDKDDTKNRSKCMIFKREKKALWKSLIVLFSSHKFSQPENL